MGDELSAAQRLIADLATFGDDAPAILDELLSELTRDEAAALTYEWEHFWHRTKQWIPDGDWHTHGYLTSRRFGKTRANAEFITREVRAGRAMRIGFMCQTEDLALQVMVEGDCGMLACSPPWFKAIWECGRVVWPNGAQAFRFTPEKPKNIRGDGVHLFWASELQSWPAVGREEAISNALIMASLGYGKLIWDGTPKRRHPLIRAMLLDAETDPKRYIVRTGVIEENADNLRQGVIADLRRKLDGTQSGREELDGQYSDDDMGALFKQEWIDNNRRAMPSQLRRRIISVDPAISERAGTDQTGISELGLGVDNQILILGDWTDRYRWEEWGDVVIDRYLAGHCDCLVLERNRGGDAVVANIRARGQSPERVRTGRTVTVERLELKAPTRWVPGVIYVKEINARGSKGDRAGPVASMYEGGRVSHVREAHLDELESLLTTWEPDPSEKRKGSPDRMDPMVHGVYELAGLWNESKNPKAGFQGIAEAAKILRQNTGRIAMPFLGGRGGGRGNTI